MAIDAGMAGLSPDDEAVSMAPQPVPADLPGLHLLLELDEDAALALRKVEPLVSAAERRPTTRKLRQVYWDTGDYQIGRAGLALGVQVLARRRVQILHDIRRLPIGGQIRQSHETALDQDGLDLPRLAFIPGIDPGLAVRLLAQTLVPIFAIDLTRTIWPIAWGDTKLSLTLEIGQIEAAAGRQPLRRLDLALLGGPPGGLYDFAQRLCRNLPVTLAGHDAPQQAYRLISGQDWWPHLREAALPRGANLRQGVLEIGRAATAAIRDEIGKLEGQLDPEQIHQARVALRRLRSALSVFGPALPLAARRALARDLGGLAARLGQAREWDVFLAETVTPMVAAIGDEPCLRSLRFAAGILRERAAAEALAAIQGPDFMSLSLRLAAWFDAGIWPEAETPEQAALLDRPLAEFARDVLRKRHRRLLAAAALADPAPAQLHSLRIDAKKLRYAAEFFRPLFPAKPARLYVAALKEVQEVLGTLNDADVARLLVPRLAMSEQSGGPRAAGIIAGWTGAEMAGARQRFAKAWQGFAECRRFWKDD